MKNSDPEREKGTEGQSTNHPITDSNRLDHFVDERANDRDRLVIADIPNLNAYIKSDRYEVVRQ